MKENFFAKVTSFYLFGIADFFHEWSEHERCADSTSRRSASRRFSDDLSLLHDCNTSQI